MVLFEGDAMFMSMSFVVRAVRGLVDAITCNFDKPQSQPIHYMYSDTPVLQPSMCCKTPECREYVYRFGAVTTVVSWGTRIYCNRCGADFINGRWVKTCKFCHRPVDRLYGQFFPNACATCNKIQMEKMRVAMHAPIPQCKIHYVDPKSNGIPPGPPIMKGNFVTVVSGQEIPIGTEGICFWTGDGKGGPRIGFKGSDGIAHFIPASNVRLTDDTPEGEEPWEA
jgi:hypothetical protein